MMMMAPGAGGAAAGGAEAAEEKTEECCCHLAQRLATCLAIPRATTTMTALTLTKSALPDKKASAKEDIRTHPNSAPPSATEDEAKTRFVEALTKGVDVLLERGHGRERASAELLNRLQTSSNSVYNNPDEDEIFQTMESLGLSMEDATKVMTVSSAFRKARTTKGGSATEAIDELTSRLNLAGLSHKGRSSRSPSPPPSAASVASAPSAIKMTELARNESIESLQSRNAQIAKKGQRPTRAKIQHQQGRGRKRALAEKTPEKRDTNVMIEEQPKAKAVAAVADLDVKEKMMNAKLAKAEGKKPKPWPRGLGNL